MTMPLPHDTTDLMLSPVTLAIDARLQEMGELGLFELAERVAVEANADPHTREAAAAALCEAVTYLIDTHGWVASWDPRGLRLTHGERSIVLGAPDGLHRYVATAGTRRSPVA